MLLKLAIMFRSLNLYSHHAHNLTKGANFFSDHEFLGDLYEFADKSYDSLIERHIGTVSDKVDLIEILKKSSDALSKVDDDFIPICLKMCEEISEEIDSAKGFSSGTLNLIQGIADELEVFIYKMKRRTKQQEEK